MGGVTSKKKGLFTWLPSFYSVPRQNERYIYFSHYEINSASGLTAFTPPLFLSLSHMRNADTHTYTYECLVVQNKEQLYLLHLRAIYISTSSLVGHPVQNRRIELIAFSFFSICYVVPSFQRFRVWKKEPSTHTHTHISLFAPSSHHKIYGLHSLAWVEGNSGSNHECILEKKLLDFAEKHSFVFSQVLMIFFAISLKMSFLAQSLNDPVARV